MMIRVCKHLIELKHVHMKQMLLKYIETEMLMKCLVKYVATYK